MTDAGRPVNAFLASVSLVALLTRNLMRDDGQSNGDYVEQLIFCSVSRWPSISPRLLQEVDLPRGLEFRASTCGNQSRLARRARRSMLAALEDSTACVERTIELRALEGLGASPRPDLIGAVLTELPVTLQDSVRMGFLRSSRAPGRVSTPLKRAADVRYLGHAAGPDDSTLLRFALPEFGQAAPELFRQRQLWDLGPREDETAIDLLAATVADVRQHVRDSVRFDPALLRRLIRYRHVFKRGITSVALLDAKGPVPVQLDPALSAAAGQLYDETPLPRRVRICGRLDMLVVSTQAVGLLLDDGARARAVWTPAGFIDIAAFLGQAVVLEGVAQFRPSGALLRVDADAIRTARPEDRFFSTLPEPDGPRDYRRAVAAVRPGERPYAAIYGIIPADESDEEFARAVEEMS